MSTATASPPTAESTPRPRLRELPPEAWVPAINEHFRGGLSGLLGVQVLRLEPGRVEATMDLREDLMTAAGDYLHAGTVVAFADSCAGWGCLASLPEGREGFTTGELKTNLVATTRPPDGLDCVGELVHGGRTTQVWDVAVTRRRDGRPIGHFRCTQFLLEAQR